MYTPLILERRRSMKRKIVFIVLCALILSGFLYLQYGRDITVNYIATESNSQGYSASLTITANKLYITEKETYTQKLVTRVAENNLPNMQLSYDVMGYPSELTITVYANTFMKQLHIPAFQVKS